MSSAIRVLIVEDLEDDALLLVRFLEGSGYNVAFETVADAKSMREALIQGTWDIVLSDYVMPGFSGLEALKILQENGINIPFIIVSGAIGEETAVEAMKAGAHDCIAKSTLARLVPAIERGLEDALARQDRKRAEEGLRAQRDFALELADSSSLYEVLLLAVDQVRKVPGIDAAGIYLVDEEKGGFDLAYAEGLSERYAEWVRHFGASSYWGRLVKDGIPLFFDCGDEQIASDAAIQSEGLLSLAILPISKLGKVYACLSAGSHGTAEIPHSSRCMLEALAAEVGGSIARVRASETLRQQLHFMQVVVDAMPNPVYFKNAEERYQGCNEAFERFTGLSRDEIIGKTAREIVPPERADMYHDRDRELIDKPGVQVFEYRAPNADGVVRNLIFNKATYTDIDGNVSGLVGVIIDITERKRAEEALRESEEKYREMFENMTSGVAVLKAVDNGEDFIYVDANKAAETLAGLDRGALGKPITEIFPGAVDLGVLEVFNRVRRTGEPERYPMLRYIDDRISGWRDYSVFKQPSGEIVLLFQDITEQVEAEQALRESESRFRELFEKSPTALFSTDFSRVKDIVDGLRASGVTDLRAYLDSHPDEARRWADKVKIVDVNETAVELYQAPDKVGLLASPAQIFIKESYPVIKEMIISLAAGMGSYESEAITQTLEGRRNNIQVRLTLDEAYAETWESVLVAVNDITELKRAEDALRESEGLYRSLIETSPDLIAVLDMQGNFIAFSSNVTERFGFTEQEIMGENAAKFLAAGDREGAKKLLDELVETGQVRNVEFDFSTKDGSRILLDTSATIIPDKDGNPRFVMAVAHDVTERKRAEEALRESEEKYRFLVETLNEGIWAIDLEGVTTFVNARMADMLGYSERDMVGKPLSAFFSPGEQDTARPSFIRDSLGIEEEVVREFEKKDGTPIYASMHAAPIFDYRGNITGSLAGVLDVTEEKMSQERQQFMVQLLELINRSGEETDTVRGMLHAIKEFMQIEAIGLRLRENDDYPYDQTEGFPEEFVRTAMYIRARDKLGQPLRGPGGEPVYECTCGDVIEGRTDGDLPFFTDTGSFWTNSMTDLFASDIGGTLNDRRLDCVSCGYESVALIPLRFEGGVAGLLQLNDHRRDMFSEDRIHFLEQVGESVGIAVARKQAEDLLKAERERYRQHFQDSTDVIFSIGAGPRMLSVSPSIERLLGYRPEELIDRPFSELNFIAPESLEKFVNDSLSVLSGESTSPSEYVFIAKDGTSKVAELKSTPLIKDGEIIGLVGVARDVTERKRLEEERNRLNEELERRVVVRTAQLEAANKELEAFSYSVSHDLQTPLRAIGGFTRMLNDEYSEALDEEGRRLLSIICQNTDYMGELIDHLLTLSRVGRREMTETEVDMNALVRQTVGELEPATSGRRVEFNISDLPPVHGDPLMWHQVWMNLLSNAVKFTGKKETGVIEVGCRSVGNGNIYFVKDNGAGFDMKYADRLFGVFRRLHSPEDFEGVGVGLALVQRIVRRHGGSVWAEGEVDKGATFYFTGRA